MKSRKRSRKADVLLSAAVLLLVALGVLISWAQLRMRRAVAQYAVDKASSIPAFRQSIGNQPNMGWFVSGRTYGSLSAQVLGPRIADYGSADLHVPVRGSSGRGHLIIWIQERFTGRRICSMELVMDDGKSIVLIPDEQSHVAATDKLEWFCR
jgi:hypothetical protein